MSNSHDKIATRLAQIIMKLNDGEMLNEKELAEEFNVSLRTVQRDIHERLAFLPLKKENGYYSLENYVLGKLSFKDIKNFAAISGMRSLYPDLTNDFIADILNSKVNAAYRINNHGFEDLSDKTDDFKQLSVAVLHNIQVTFTYNDKKRELNPYKLINNNGIWYLAADEAGVLKTYGFSKIKNLCITENHFTPNPEFEQKVTDNTYKWFSDEIIEVTLQIDTKLAEYFLRRDILPNQKIIEQTPDRLIISTEVAYDEEILGIVKHGIPYIKILSPHSLQEKLQNILQNYLQMS
jgi:predicted DNA-binding transcriptional regulator YafY